MTTHRKYADTIHAVLNMGGTSETREDKARIALGLLRMARDLLVAADAVRTVEKLRAVMPSAEGAVRAAHYRDMRHSEEERTVREPCPGEGQARHAGYRVVTFPDDPGKFYWQKPEAVAFVGADTIEAAWLAAVEDMHS